jgi:hypothetical protein
MSDVTRVEAIAIDRERLGGLLIGLHSKIADAVASVLDMIEQASNPDEDTRAMLADMMRDSDALKHLLVDGGFPELEPGPPLTIGLIEADVRDSALSVTEWDVLCVLGDCAFPHDLLVDEHKILLVKGVLSARNVRVHGHLFVDGDLECRVLFGASGNDNMTLVSGTIRAEAIVENGHYTRAEAAIETTDLICIHNEISAPSLLAKGLLCEDRNAYVGALNPACLTEDGYFDEEALLRLIDADQYRIGRD